MPFYDDGTSLPAESALSPDEVAEIIKQRKLKEQQRQQQGGQQAASPSSQGGGKDKPRPSQQGPAAPGQPGGIGALDAVGKFIEEKISIPVVDFVDNTFQGNQRTPDQIARDRARARVEGARRDIEAQRNLDAQPGSMVLGEAVRAVTGGAEDLLEGVVNLPGQVTTLFGQDYKPVNFGLVRENSTTVGDGMRTLSRYVMGGLGVGAVTRGGLGAGMTGFGLFGARAAQGFMEDFVSADGTKEDNTLIGSTPFTQWLQTSDKNNPIHNRALVGLEGALFEAAGLPAVKALWQVSGAGQAARNLGKLSDSYLKGRNQQKLFEALDRVQKATGVQLEPLTPASTQEQINALLEKTRSMLAEPQVLADQRKARAVAEYQRAVREAAAPRLAMEAQGRLKTLLARQFANDNFGSTLDYTRTTERDLALRLIKEDPQRIKLNALITEAAGTADSSDPIFDYLRQRVDAFQASKQLDEIAETVQYGGKPDERVLDATRLPEIEDNLADLDSQINEIGATVSQADEALTNSDGVFQGNAKLGGTLNQQIAVLQSQLESLPTEAQAAAASAIRVNLSTAQVKRLQGIQLPEGITITPGRRVVGLTADNIDEFRAAIAELAASGDQVAQNLSLRLDNLEVPAKQNFQTREAVAQQIEALKAQRGELFAEMVPQRQEYYQARAQRNNQAAALEELRVRREAIAARASGTEEQFTANYVPVNMTTSNITSIVKEGAGGQPGFDLYFEDKRFPALLNGRVKEIGRQGTQAGGYGNYVVIESIDPKTGQTVDVLYGHLADGSIKVKEGDMVGVGQQVGTQGGTGSVRSVDGTIASVDFLAPAPKGSKSMTPYARWSQLVDELSEGIRQGTIQPSQVGNRAPSVTPEVVLDAARQADEVVTTMTRAEAVEQGFEVDQVTPVQPRTNIVDDFVQGAEPVSGTAKPGTASLTDMDAFSLAQGAQGQAILERVMGDIDRKVEFTELEAIEAMPEAQALFKEFMDADDETFTQLLDDPRFVESVDGSPIFSGARGLAANGLVLRELQRQIIDLADGVLRHMEDGAPQARQDSVRLADRMMAMAQIRTEAKKTASGALRNYDYVGRNLEAFDEGATGASSNVLKRLQEDLSNQLAKEDNLYRSYQSLRQRLVAGDPAAFKELQRTAKAMQIMHPTQKNFRAMQTALAGVGKDLDALYINSILSGPITQQRNIWGNFYQTIGHPIQAMLGAALPGPEHAVVRRQAVAALGSVWDSRRDMADLFGRLYSKNWEAASDAKEYVIWDEKLSRNMLTLQDKIERGEVDFVTSAIYGTAINLRKIIDSPFMRPMMAFMGATDGYFKVLAARQVAARRAVEYALEELGDAPITGVRAQKFGQLVSDFKEAELKKIFDADGLTIIDPEAKELGDSFTFQTPLSEDNVFSRLLNRISSDIPGMKVLGFTFVKTPANILRSAANLTPGLSRLLKLRDEAYKNGDAYYRAMRDGAEAMSYVIGGLGMVAGMNGTMTGAGPLRGEERELWLQNHKPFTITVGGLDISYQGLEPAASVLGMFADLGALLVDDAPEKNYLASALSIVSSNIINKSYLAQLSVLSQVVTATDPSELARVVENWGRGLLPYSGARSQWGQIIDGAAREVRSQIEPTWSWFLKKHMGLGASMNAPQQVDPLNGKPLTRDGVEGPVSSLVSMAQMAGLGLRLSKNRFRPVHRLLEEVGFDIPAKTRQLVGEQLTNEEMVEYTRLRADGGAFERDLLEYFNSDQYKKVDAPQSKFQRQQGMKETETDAYMAVDSIYQMHHGRAVGIMEAGLTAPSASYAQRLQATRVKKAGIEQIGNTNARAVRAQQTQQIIDNYNY